MKTIEKIVVFLCAYLFCGWGTLFVQNAKAIDEGNLRLFAYGLRVVYSEATETYTFYFKSTSAPKSGELVFYYDKDEDDNQNELSSIVGRYTFPLEQDDKGEYSFSLDKKDIPVEALKQQAYLDMTWAIELKGEKIIGRNTEATAALDFEKNNEKAYNYQSYAGTSNKVGPDNMGALYEQVREPRRIMEDHHFQKPQGIAIDNNPLSKYFGRVYIANTPAFGGDGDVSLSNNMYKAGITVFEPDPQTGKYKKIADGIMPKGVSFPTPTTQFTYFYMHCIAVNPANGYVYYSNSASSSASAIYQLKPTKNEDGCLDWENAVNVTKNLIPVDGFQESPLHSINSLAFGPGGELYVMCKAGDATDPDTKCGQGKIYKLTKSDGDDLYDGYEQHYIPRTEPQLIGQTAGTAKGKPFMIDPWVDSDNSMVVTARGGFWVSQKRNAGINDYAFLAHIQPDGYVQQSKYGTGLEKHFQFALSTVEQETFSAFTITPDASMKHLLAPHKPSSDIDVTYPTGQIALYEKGGLNSKEAMLAVGFKGKVCVFKLFYDDDNGTWYGFNLDWMFEIPIGGSGTTIDGLAFDYAGNLFVVSGSRHKLYVYSLPNYDAMKDVTDNDYSPVQPLTFASGGGRLYEFTNGTASTPASNNLNRGKPLDDNHVATPAKFDWTVDAAIVYDQKYNSAFDTQWSTETNWNIQRIPDKTDIPVIIRSDANISNINQDGYSVSGLMLENGSHLTIAHDGGLTVGEGGITGAATDGSSITIQNYSSEYLPDNQQGAGYLRIHPNVEQQTKVTVNYITKGRPDETNPLSNNDLHWQYVGAPGDDTEITISNHTWIYKWDAANQEWVKQSGTFNLEPFKGYAITQKDMPSYTWTTTAINKPRTVSLLQGNNIFANSYLAPINVAAFDANDFEGGVQKTFYIFNTGSWNEWRAGAKGDTDGDTDGDGVKEGVIGQAAGQYTAIPVLSAENLNKNTDPTTIAPMQGVYVKATGPGAIKLDYEKHVWDTEKPGTTAMRAPEKTTSPDLLRRIRIQAYGENSGSDRMYILQDMRCTPDYDNGYDGKNMNAAGQVNIYTNEPCGRMEISSTNHIDSMYIGFRAGPDTTYTLRFTSLIGDSLCIKDLANDSIIPLYEDSTYTFYAAAKSVNNMRFQVLLHPNPADDYSDTDDNSGTTTDVDNVSTSQLWMADQHLCISNQMANSTAKIYSVSGQLLISEKFNYQIDIPVYNLTTGVYILEVNNERYKFIRQN
jgi:hypothetical protein